MKVGDKVYFGRPNGQKTLGEIVKVNRKTYKVKQLEVRGQYKAYPVGSVWGVPKTLVWAEDPGVITKQPRRRRNLASWV